MKATGIANVEQTPLTESPFEETPFTVAVDDALGSLVDALVETERSAAKIAAWRVEQVNQLRRFAELNIPVTTSHGMRPWGQAATARRTAVSEVAAALRIPERSAETLIEESRMLVEQLPETLEGLRRGDFDYRHAKVIVNHAASLPDELHAEFERVIVPYASRLTVSKLDQRARTARERMDASTIQARHEKSMANRELSYEPARDGMAWLHHYLPATNALAIYNRVTDIARELDGPNEARTLTQLRADVATDLLLDGEVSDRAEFSIRPWVAVTIPVLSMLDCNRSGHESPGAVADLPILEGYGPIDIETAKRLAGSAKSWLRVLTHPETGTTLSVGRERYAVPADLRSWLRLHDGTCRKVGCNRSAARCDLDHTQEWQNGGQTAHDNLAHLCPMHHNEKHHTAVTMKHLPNGDIEWTLASGRTYISEPNDRVDR